jgi:uncharacterized protein YdhG (YjbR/CyaY superfamily)
MQAAIKEYIAQFPAPVQERLHTLYALIRELAPEAEESISYGMPGFKTNKKPLVYFAGYAKHIGFYATPNAHSTFSEALKGYKQGKGSVQFPLDAPMPMELIRAMVQFRIEENQARK